VPGLINNSPLTEIKGVWALVKPKFDFRDAEIIIKDGYNVLENSKQL